MRRDLKIHNFWTAETFETNVKQKIYTKTKQTEMLVGVELDVCKDVRRIGTMDSKEQLLPLVHS